jgi:hypothetical protein
VRKDIFHLIQLYSNCIVKDHKLALQCKQELNCVFFGEFKSRSKDTAVPGGDILKPLLVSWYKKWDQAAGVFKSTMKRNHELQLTHVTKDCVSDPAGVQVLLPVFPFANLFNVLSYR